jgi:hypothetical protein
MGKYYTEKIERSRVFWYFADIFRSLRALVFSLKSIAVSLI